MFFKLGVIDASRALLGSALFIGRAEIFVNCRSSCHSGAPFTDFLSHQQLFLTLRRIKSPTSRLGLPLYEPFHCGAFAVDFNPLKVIRDVQIAAGFQGVFGGGGRGM